MTGTCFSSTAGYRIVNTQPLMRYSNNAGIRSFLLARHPCFEVPREKEI